MLRICGIVGKTHPFSLATWHAGYRTQTAGARSPDAGHKSGDLVCSAYAAFKINK